MMAEFTGEHSPEYLAAELAAIHDRDGWDSPRAVALLTRAKQKLAGLARREGADPADAVTAAWEAWRDRSILDVDNAWVYTYVRVRNTLRTEGVAERKLTSEQGLRRQGIEDFAGVYDADITEMDHELVALAPPAERAPLRLTALTTAVGLLVEHGYGIGHAQDVVESMVDKAAHSSSPQRAADELVRDRDLPSALDINVEEWKSIATMLFGSPRGAIGLVEAEVRGIEPDEKHIRLARNRFERVPVLA